MKSGEYVNVGRCVVVCLMLVHVAHCQQPIGSVRTEQADVSGLVNVSGGKAVIQNNGAVTAREHAADVTLMRGGSVRVCATSALHLSQSNGGEHTVSPLMVALDRGAAELKWNAGASDVILTSDLRFDLSNAGPLDVQLRVTPSGDTCVDNRGKGAPVLHVTEQFGTGGYFVKPGQRVLFEHGSLREVVDRESSACGCPSANGLVLAGSGKSGDGKVTKASKEHPFPEAVSQGLAKSEVPQGPIGQDHVQVSTALAYDGANGTASSPTIGKADGGSGNAGAGAVAVPAVGGGPSTMPAATGGNASVNSSPSPAPVPAAALGGKTDAAVVDAGPPPAGPNPFKAVGRFFKRLFGGGR